jgi:two-component system response regulator (stage 0 sporulation protein A)
MESCFDEKESFCVSRATEQIKEITSFFVKIGLYANLKGFDYLICAVEEVLKYPELLHSMTKVLYPKVAERFSTTACGVERNIRNAIEIACNRGKLCSVANLYYGGNFAKYEKPTNGEFIAFLINIAKSA